MKGEIIFNRIMGTFLTVLLLSTFSMIEVSYNKTLGEEILDRAERYI